jgi:ribosomal protein S17
MTSKEVINYIEKEGIDALYKKYIRHFSLVDTWEQRLVQGDLLTEFELSQAQDQLTGVFMALYTVAGALEAYCDYVEANTKVAEFGKLETIKTQDTTVVNAKANVEVAKYKKYFMDFDRYAKSAQQGILNSQSRLKRLTVEKGSGYRGEVPVKEDEPNWA